MVLLPPFLGPGFRLGGITWCARFECGSCAQFAVDEKDLMIEWLHALKVCGAALSTKKLDGAPTTELLYEKATKPGKKTVDIVASCTAMTQKYEAQLEEVTFPKSRDLPHLFWSGLCVIGVVVRLRSGEFSGSGMRSTTPSWSCSTSTRQLSSWKLRRRSWTRL